MKKKDREITSRGTGMHPHTTLAHCGHTSWRARSAASRRSRSARRLSASAAASAAAAAARRRMAAPTTLLMTCAHKPGPVQAPPARNGLLQATTELCVTQDLVSTRPSASHVS